MGRGAERLLDVLRDVLADDQAEGRVGHGHHLLTARHDGSQSDHVRMGGQGLHGADRQQLQISAFNIRSDRRIVGVREVHLVAHNSGDALRPAVVRGERRLIAVTV